MKPVSIPRIKVERTRFPCFHAPGVCHIPATKHEASFLTRGMLSIYLVPSPLIFDELPVK